MPAVRAPSKGEASARRAKLPQNKSSMAALLAFGERCTDEAAERALGNDQDRNHASPVSLRQPLRVVLLSTPTFTILKFFFFPAEARLA